MESENSKLYTDRFFLRELECSDSNERYLSWFDDEEIKKYIPSAKKKQTIESIQDYILYNKNIKRVIFWGIFNKTDSRHIGNIKYEISEDDPEVAIMGVLIGEKEFRGKKVFPEIYLTTCSWLKEKRGVNKVILGVNKAHLIAIRSYKKIGFKEVSDDKFSSHFIENTYILIHSI